MPNRFTAQLNVLKLTKGFFSPGQNILGVTHVQRRKEVNLLGCCEIPRPLVIQPPLKKEGMGGLLREFDDLPKAGRLCSDIATNM
jgi:hypothetical protein